MTEVLPATIIDHATWFVDHGISILPVDGKTGDVKKASPSTKLIKNNYGVALGKGLIGIDFDEHDGAEGISLFGTTRMWKSGSHQGYGILYRVPDELSNSTFSICPGITVRGCGSYLVGPGSIHPGTPKKNIAPGGVYTLVNDNDIEEAPEWLIKLLELRAASVKETNLELKDLIKPDKFFKDTKWLEKFNIEGSVDRSGKTYELAAYSAERGASNEELAWTITNFKPAIDKGYLAAEVPRIISKVRDLHKHSGKPCDTAKCPNKPEWMTKEVEVFDLWSSRQEFKEVKQAAESRMVAPKAVLMSVLCHIAASIPVDITIPAIIGKRASLNFFVVFVGKSGGGKGASTGVAGELYDYAKTGVKYKVTTPASGEGVVSTYIRYDSEAKAEIQKDTNALINFDEIDNLRATTDRQGSTLSAMLRQGFSGETLGYQLSKRNTELAPHSYRMALQLSAQPAKSDWLLEDGDGGLPQRFVFVSTSNPERPDIDDLPEFPTITPWSVPSEITQLKKTQEIKQIKKDGDEKPGGVFGKLDANEIETYVKPEKKFVDIKVCNKAVRAIRLARQDSLDEKEGDLEGHALLVRLKVAALLGIWNGRLEISEEDWDLSAVIMSWSNQAKNKIRYEINLKNQKIQVARTTAAADRQEYIEKRSEDSNIAKVAENLLNWMEKGVTHLVGTGSLKQKIRRDKNHYIDDAIELLIKADKVKRSEDGKELHLK